MIKDPVAEAVAQAWDTVIERARAQGPEALRKMEEMRREAEREAPVCLRHTDRIPPSPRPRAGHGARSGRGDDPGGRGGAGPGA